LAAAVEELEERAALFELDDDEFGDCSFFFPEVAFGFLCSCTGYFF